MDGKFQIDLGDFRVKKNLKEVRRFPEKLKEMRQVKFLSKQNKQLTQYKNSFCSKRGHNKNIEHN